MKLLKMALVFSVVLYLVAVGLLALLKFMGFSQRLSTPEMFYGPAITVVSTWIIFGIVHFFLERKRSDKTLKD